MEPPRNLKTDPMTPKERSALGIWIASLILLVVIGVFSSTGPGPLTTPPPQSANPAPSHS